MHLLRFSSTFLSKLNCFALLFILATFSPTVMASDSEDSNKIADSSDSDSEVDAGDVKVEEDDDAEQGAGNIDLENVISSIAPGGLRDHLINYRNEKGQNFLHLIRPEQFERFAKLVADDMVVGNMLLFNDDDRIWPFNRLVDADTISPRFIQIVTARRSSENDTLLMAAAMRDAQISDKLSTLASKGVTIDQVDIYGNTAESIDADWCSHDRLSYLMVANNPNIERYKSKSLSNALWQQILDDKYALYMRRLFGSQKPAMQAEDFAAIAFETVYKQRQSGVHTAFVLMEDSSSDYDRRLANDLWKDFFKAHDTLLSEEEAAQAQKLPLSGRILSVVSDHQYLPELHDATAQLIAGSSRFGVKFKKATEEEAEAYVWGIRSYVSHLLSTDRNSDFDTRANCLTTAFKRRPYREVTDAQMHKLMKHHLKCTVVALYTLNEFDKGSTTAPRTQKLNEDKIFNFIDSTLTGWPNETSINSRALFANVQGHLRTDSTALDFDD